MRMVCEAMVMEMKMWIKMMAEAKVLMEWLEKQLKTKVIQMTMVMAMNKVIKGFTLLFYFDLTLLGSY